MRETVSTHLVGIFDSGIGGLTVLEACRSLAPQNVYLYYGDNARAPYGSRRPAQIARFTREALDKFRALGAEVVLLACNTATAVCAETMRREFAFPVLGLEPAVKPAAEVCRNVLVLATPRTAKSARLKRLAARFPQCRFTLYGAEGLAGEIERALTEGRTPDYEPHLPKGDFDGVVLGCTHYCFLRREISAFYRLPVFDGNEGAARQLILTLRRQNANECFETENHKKPPISPQGYLTKISKKSGIFFLGEGANVNKEVYFRTFVFRKN